MFLKKAPSYEPVMKMAGNGKRIVKTKAIISSILIALYVGAVF